jgi:hypothetical protein
MTEQAAHRDTERDPDQRDGDHTDHTDGSNDQDTTLSTDDIARSGADGPGDLLMAGNGREAGRDSEHREPLLPADDIDDLDTRWTELQSRFVDEPRDAVQGADALVAELMQRLATMFADEREKLEAQWTRGDEVSTEDLRVALQRYRSFFQRLLAA